MDISLLKTFLELQRTRHFGRAAKNLFLTQSAVSARLRLLEETLGVQLLYRERNNIRLTSAGARFLPYAETIVSAWNRARQTVAVPDEEKVPLSVGGVYSLWDTGLQDWLHQVHRTLTGVALRADAHSPEALVRRLLDGVIDLGFTFESPPAGELVVRQVGPIELVMVSSRKGLTAEAAVNEADYLMVDWGTAFGVAHARHFPNMPAPSLHMGLGRIALAFLLEFGGPAYLAEGMGGSPLAAERLFLVEDAPRIEREVYAAYAPDSPRRKELEEALELLPSTWSSGARDA